MLNGFYRDESGRIPRRTLDRPPTERRTGFRTLVDEEHATLLICVASISNTYVYGRRERSISMVTLAPDCTSKPSVTITFSPARKITFAPDRTVADPTVSVLHAS